MQLSVHWIPAGNYDKGFILQDISVFLTEMSSTLYYGRELWNGLYVYYSTFLHSLPKCSLRVHCIPERNYDTGCMLQATSVFLTEMSCTCISVGNYETGCIFQDITVFLTELYKLYFGRKLWNGLYVTGHLNIPYRNVKYTILR